MDSISQDDEDLLFGKDGMFWTRKFSQNEVGDDNCKILFKSMELLDVTSNKGGMVVGHTPQSNINSQCNNRVWRIDTGMSEAFGKRQHELARIEVLEILNNGETINTLR